MRNLALFFQTILLILVASCVAICQPELTVWRVTADHQEDHEHAAASVGEKFQYDCGVYYYLVHKGVNVDMHFALRNDGDEDLQLEIPIQMSMLSSELLEVTSQPGNNTLAPGEETMITISYHSPPEYLPGQKGSISFASNDLLNPYCGFSIEIGQQEEEMDPQYCVCEEGDTTTLTDNSMIASPGGESGIIFTFEPNQLLLHSGPCTMEDTCPSEESLACYFSNRYPRFSTGIAGGRGPAAVGTASFYIEVAPGYCPCIIEDDFCIRDLAPDDLALPEECSGDERTFEVHDCMTCDCVDACGTDESKPPHFDFPEDYTYEWCTDGIGTFSDNTGLDATLQGWFHSDILLVKVTDEEGCLGVGWKELRSYDRVPIVLDDEPSGCIQDGIRLCFDADESLKERNTNNFRSDGVQWYTNGDGEFSDPGGINGEHCITIKGMKLGDKVYAIDYQSEELPDDCPLVGFFDSRYSRLMSCMEALENVGLGGISLDDPCNCEDPLNVPAYPEGPTEFFHDILSIENLPSFVNATIYPGVNFLDAGGAPFAGPFNVTTDMWGRAEVDFWHVPDAAGFANITSDYSQPRVFESSICAACAPIPTIGQWGLIILGFLVLIVGVVYIRKSIIAGINT